jgi:rubrerythrin
MSITGDELRGITDAELREIFRKIAANERPHGGFLREFATALQKADDDNFLLLKPSALAFAIKYNLWDYRFDADAIKEFPPSQ